MPKSATRTSRSDARSRWGAHVAHTLSSLATSRRLPLYLALLGATLVSPSLFVGFQLDDYAHRFCSLRSPGAEALCPSSLSLFTIATGRPEVMHRAIEDGLAPFWAYDRLVIDFLRPLSAATHFVDYHFFPGAPAVMHAENIAWLAGSVFLATLLYRSLFGVGVLSGAAAFAFAVDHVHGVPAGWIANRNAVMGAFFGTAALVAYQRTTRSPSVRMGAAGVTCLVLGLLSGEIALGAWAYLAAHALVLDERPVGRRLRGLGPYAIATVAWRVAYSTSGHGAMGSGLYLDPVREPLTFLRAVPARVPLLLQGVFGFPPAEGVFFTTPALARAFLAGTVVFSLALVVTFGSLARRNRTARFWALGASLSLLSVCSAVPHNRLLYFPSLGGVALLATAIDALAKSEPWLPRGVPRKVSQLVVAVSGGLHAFVSPLLLPLAACTVLLTHGIADRAVPSALATMPDAPHENLIFVTAPEYYAAEYLRLVQRARGGPEPAKVRLLSVGSVALRARRLDPHTLELTYENGLLQSVPLWLYRDGAHPMKAGETVRLDGLSIVVTRVTADGRPAVATFAFEEPLDSPKLRWVVWHDDHYIPFSPPRKDGDAVDVEPAESEFTVG